MATPSSFDPKPFRDFEQAGWNTTADKYDGTLGSATAAFSAPLLDAAGVQRGTRVLDVAPEDQDAVFEELRQVGVSATKQECTGLREFGASRGVAP